MSPERRRRTILATIATLLWFGYMVVGLALIEKFAPTVNGNGPAGTAAFVGLVGGVVWAGFVMWAASD